MIRRSRLLLAVSAAVLLPATASAETLNVGLGSEPTAVDPHYHDLGPNNAMVEHIFEALVAHDKDLKIVPELATEWERRDDNTWVFTLREGVTFSNGEPFTAKDVIFTLCRVLNNETGQGSFTDVASNTESLVAEGETTLVVTTKVPEPLLLAELTDIPILSSSIVEHGELTFDPANGCGVTGAWPTVEQFNDGSVAIGTGPYALEDYTKGDSITLSANETYWGEAPAFETVVFTAVPSDGPRLAGLLAGDYDLIENPAPRDLPRIEENPNLDYVVTPSNRVIFLQMDTYRDVGESPTLEAEGENPFKDVRVRRAISKAIDRDAIVERIMDGVATPAYQYLPDSMFGALPEPPVLEYDPEEAKRLLAEAGYPDGFKVTLATPNDRYINDERVAQAVAQFLARIGIDASVDAMSRSVFFPKRRERAFSMSMAGWGSSTGEASSFLRAFVVTEDPERDVGGSNYGGYTSEKFDTVFLPAIESMDEAEREQGLMDSMKVALEEMPLIPLHYESSTWAFRDGISYPGRADQATIVMDVEVEG
ncbi:ABC transporter substrate-binding protein [Acuticoccus sp.]|uniref:ABC transporter substrate-binding protein n=1 Tax=Acuticoccus sp. TaxID=1904378 RepID=UPI003B525A49